MIDLPPTLQELIGALRHIPGIGTKSAERIALTLLKTKEAWPEALVHSIQAARQKIKLCTQCGFFAEDNDFCEICRSPSRDNSLLCLVETPNDILPLERAGIYRGLYHSLGGKLSPLEGIGPENLNLASLYRRIEINPPREIILALGTDVEGETTTLYVIEQLRHKNIALTQPAHGLPLGSSLDLTDSLTLKRALQDRRTI